MELSTKFDDEKCDDGHEVEKLCTAAHA